MRFPVAGAAADNAGQQAPNTRRHYDVSRKDLPLHCPMAGMSVWNSHPRVFLPVEETGEAKCPYCGAEYTLVD
ncbi:MAG: zinc-finger domain-containing protein [Gammaproteobacteria bacterium]